jgi:2-iminobutanoate/2-iminopropanoate deaminase
MTEKTQNSSPPTLTKPLARYSHARRVGDLLFVAGQGCRSPETNDYAGLTRDAAGNVTKYDIAAQARACLANIEAVLKANGLTKEAIVDVTVFLRDMQDFPAMNAVWNDYFDVPMSPTRTTVAVRELPGLNYVEMKTIATFGLVKA